MKNSAWILIEINEGILGSTSLHKTEKERARKNDVSTPIIYIWRQLQVDPDANRAIIEILGGCGG